MKHAYPTPNSTPRLKRTRTLSGPAYMPGRGGATSVAKYVASTKISSSSFGALMRANTPLKYYISADTVATSGTLHNTVYSTPITSRITQGTGDANRIGDEIFLKFLKVRGSLYSGSSSGAYIHRVIIGFSNVQSNTTNATASGISPAMFQPGTDTNYCVNGIINAKNFTCLYDQTFDIPSEIPATNNGLLFEANVPLERKFQYQGAASVYGKKNNLYFIHLSTVLGGTIGVTNTGRYDVSMALGFVDN